MKKKFLITLLLLVCAVTCAFGLAACKETTGGGGETCTVRFDAERGTIFGNRFFETNVDKNSTVEEPNQEPVCDGYIFIGWNLTGDEDYAMWDFDTEKVTQDTTLRAVWVREYTVTFNADGGAFPDGNDTYIVTVADGAKISAPNVTPPDDNYLLKGWLNGSAYWDFTTKTVWRNMTLKADWTYTDAVVTALAPFIYSERFGHITITGVKDKEAVTSLAVPSVVTYIDDYAFKDCVNLETVVIDDSVSYIGMNAFWGCSKLRNVTLPTGLNEIRAYTFNGCTALEAIDLPETLVRLGAGAFYHCSSLTAAELPAGITEIPGATFCGCTSLKEVKLGANVRELGAYAFEDCASLEEFGIPSGVTMINGGLFQGCLSLKSITVPAVCTEINSYAFQNSGLVTAVIHAQKVDLCAFEGCTSLVNLTIGAEVRELGDAVFNGCTSLTEVEIPDTVEKTEGNVFRNCSGLKTVSIGDGLAEISGGMFSGCSSLRNVEFGSLVSSIKSGAFADCISLLSFTVPFTVTSVDRKAFEGCARLVELYNLTGAPDFLNSAKPMTDTVIHTSVSDESIIETVDGFSFCMMKDSTYPYPEVPFLLDYTGDKENLVLPADYEGKNYKIFKYALSFNPQLKSVTISDGVEAIREEILLGSDNVTTLTVGSGNTYFTSKNNCVISTADSKFVLGCKTSVIPTDGSVTAIGSNVFCHNKTIVNDAFKIPDSVTVVERSAFDGIEGIARTEGYVQYVDKWAVCLVYDGRDYIDLELAEGTVGIAASTFNPYNNNYIGGRHIKSVKTNAELKYIGEEAFSFCDFITEVTLNNGLVLIEGSAFTSCSKLEEIVIPDTVTTLGSGVFHGCTALTYAKLPSGISIINYQTFDGCTSLKEIVIPSSVTRIEHRVFNNCPSTLKVYYCGGDASAWNLIIISGDNNSAGTASTSRYYYSETPQAGVATWHYGEDGKPTTQY